MLCKSLSKWINVLSGHFAYVLMIIDFIKEHNVVKVITVNSNPKLHYNQSSKINSDYFWKCFAVIKYLLESVFIGTNTNLLASVRAEWRIKLISIPYNTIVIYILTVFRITH